MTSIEKAIKGKTLSLPNDRKIGFCIREGADADRVFVLSSKARITLGRETADIVLHDPVVSKVHCAVEVYGDVIVLRDHGSASGTFLNDLQIKEELLKDRDKIRLGNTVLQIYVKLNE